jgi:uncharacterized RDD family membrane protein YckC
VAGLPQSAYTPWITRVVAFIIDQLPLYILSGIGYGIWIASAQGTACVNDTSEYDLGQFCAEGFVEPSGVGWAALLLTGLVSFAFAIWNYGYRQGTTGSSIGKSIMKFKVVSEKTGQPIGFGLSIVRQLAHIVDTIICYIGYLFPLWDAKRQTLADKIMTTVCLPI